MSIRTTYSEGKVVYCAQDIIKENFDTLRPGQYWNYFKDRFGDQLKIYKCVVPSNKATRRICKLDFITAEGRDFILSYRKGCRYVDKE